MTRKNEHTRRMLSRKETSWKKSRKFGDVKGGRKRPKLADNIFSRAHSITRPSEGEQLPIYINDNASRDFFFPIGQEEVARELSHLPKRDWSGITHIWFRRFKKSEYEAKELPLAEFSCGLVSAPLEQSQQTNFGRSGRSVCF